MDTLRTGSHGQQVVLLQRLLNTRLNLQPPLFTDAFFGPSTRAAVIQFQHSLHMPEDGVVGPRTWSALGVNNLQFHLRHYRQPDPMTCWSACATMISGTNRSVGPGSARMDPGRHGLIPEADNVQAFARSIGLQASGPHGARVRPVMEITNFLRGGPLILIGFLMVDSSGQGRHAIVIAGIMGDGTPRHTLLTIYDPAFPPDRGGIRRTVYDGFVEAFPLGMDWVLYRATSP